MTLSRQKFREIVFQLLYSYDMGKTDDEEILHLLASELSIDNNHLLRAHKRMHDILALLTQIDAWITRISSSYAFERIQSVERNILRLGVFEMLYDDAIPAKVAISEAMRIARKFSTKASAIFINAVLDNIYKTNSGEKADDTQIAQALKGLTTQESLTQSIQKTITDNPDANNLEAENPEADNIDLDNSDSHLKKNSKKVKKKDDEHL